MTVMNPGLFSAIASGSLLAAVWQGTLLAACVALCLRLLPGLSAAARSVIWTAVLILAACLHVVPLFAGHAVESHASIHADPHWSFVVAALWAALTLYRGSQLVRSGLRLHRIARRATPVAGSPALRQGSRHARLCTSNDVDRPSVVGFFSPRVLLPPAFSPALLLRNSTRSCCTRWSIFAAATTGRTWFRSSPSPSSR